MHSFSEVIAALNDLRDRGIVNAYAIAGAMAATFWDEAIPTFDLDVLIRLPGDDSTIVGLDAVYRWAADNGYTLNAEHIVIGDVPVQFLPAYNSLAEEAVQKAKVLKYRELQVVVVSREYLIALALDPAAKTARRRERAAMLAESAALETAVLADIMRRYNLSW